MQHCPCKSEKTVLPKCRFVGIITTWSIFGVFFVKILKEYLKNAAGIAILYFIVIIRRRRREKAPADPICLYFITLKEEIR